MRISDEVAILGGQLPSQGHIFGKEFEDLWLSGEQEIEILHSSMYPKPVAQHFRTERSDGCRNLDATVANTCLGSISLGQELF